MEVGPVPVPGRAGNSVDAYTPSEIAQRVRTSGVEEAHRAVPVTFWLAVIGGAMLGLAAAGATAAMAGGAGHGATRVVGGVVFGLGLTLVMVGGGELFTSNNLIAMAWASRRVTTRRMLANWGVVYLGNALGAVSVAVLLHLGGAYGAVDDPVAVGALATALEKTDRAFHQHVALGVLGNALVCLAVWLCFSARSTTDRVLACVLPMTALVVLQVDHVVANLHYLAAGTLVGASGAVGSDGGAGVTASGVVGNLAGVTIGNVVGGSLLVACVYWFVYLRPADAHAAADARGEEAGGGPESRGRDSNP